MRETKFRAKRVDSGEWLYCAGVLNLPNGQSAAMHLDDAGRLTITLVQPETVGQWTGLRDRNGVQVFEGDIMRRPGNVLHNTYIVTWEHTSARCGFNTNGAGTGVLTLKNTEVIGNIHENGDTLTLNKEPEV